MARSERPDRRFPVDDAWSQFVDDLIEQRPESDPVIPTGLGELDELLAGGLRRGQLTVLGGVPGVGTSTLALNIAANAAIRHGRATMFIAPDSARQEVLRRVVSAEAKIPVSHLRGGRVTDDDRLKAERRREELATAPLHIAAGYTTSATPLRIGSAIEAQMDHDVRLAVVDGAAFTEPNSRDLVKVLKLVAQRYGISVVLTAKAVMPAERTAEPPWLTDLRDYAEVADLLDLVIMIHREDVFDVDSHRPGEADLAIVKHRYGPTRRLTVAFQGHYARFVDVATPVPRKR